MTAKAVCDAASSADRPTHRREYMRQCPAADAERRDDAVAPAAARRAGDDEGHVRAGHDVERKTGEREGEEGR